MLLCGKPGESLVFGLAWSEVRFCSEPRGGEGVGVVLLYPRRHFFADQASQVEVLAGVAGAHEATQLHGAVGEVGDLKATDPVVPQRRGMNDGLELFSQVFHWNGVVDVKKGGAEDVGGVTGPVLEGILDEVAEG